MPLRRSRPDSGLSSSTEGSNTVPAPVCQPQGQTGRRAKRWGLGRARSPGRKPAPLAAPLRHGEAAPRPLRPGSGAGCRLFTAPFVQAYPASHPPGGPPGQRSPASLTAPCKRVAAAAAVIAASAVRSQDTTARGGRTGPGQSRPGGGGAGHTTSPSKPGAPLAQEVAGPLRKIFWDL